MHDRMEGLYTAAKHLGCFGDIGDVSLDLVGYHCHIMLEASPTHSIGNPASLIFFAVPPEPSKRTPDWDSAVARSMRFALS